MKGLDGIQGPIYVGTGSVFRRRAFYGYDAPKSKKAPGRTCNCLPRWSLCCSESKKKKAKMATSAEKKKDSKDNLKTQSLTLQEIEESIEGYSHTCNNNT